MTRDETDEVDELAVAVEVLLYVHITSYTPFLAGGWGKGETDDSFFFGVCVCVCVCVLWDGLGFLCRFSFSSVSSVGLCKRDRQ